MRSMSVGIVELSADEPRLATSLGEKVAWHSSSQDLGTSLVQRPVEKVVFHVTFQRPHGLINIFHQVRELNPEATILLAASSANDLLIAEIKSLVSTTAPRRDMLSEREREVLSAIRSGKTNREIASQLGISRSTVNRHVENILHKKSARNRAQAAAE
jgi:DNA-binding CsgD family transcriptional regulator